MKADKRVRILEVRTLLKGEYYMRVHGIMQHDNRDCGVACLATICRFFGIKIPITKLREEMKVDKNGTSLYSINKEAQKYGLEPLVMQGTYNELYNDSKNRKIKLPLIVHIIKNNYECHYAILTKMHRDCVFLFDPAIGNIKISNLEFERIWSGYIISFKKSNVFKRKNLCRNQYKKFWNIFLEQKDMMSLILLFSALLSVIMLISSYSYQIIIDNYILKSENNSSLGRIESNGILRMIILNANFFFIMIIAIYLIQMGINIIKNFLISKASYRVNKKLIHQYFQTTLHLPISFFSNRETGEVISRLADINDIEKIITETPVTIIINSFMVLISGVVLYSISKNMFLIVVCIIIIYGIVVLSYKKSIHDIKISALENNSKLISRLKETVDNMMGVKSNCIEHAKEDELGNIGEKMLQSIFRGEILSKTEGSILLSVENIGTIITLWIGSGMAIRGGITVGNLVAFESLVGFFLAPFQQLIDMQLQLQGAWIAMGRLNDIFDAKPEKNEQNTIGEENYKKNVIYRNVSFSYGEDQVIEDVNVIFEYGKKYAITGKSGCGKSTLMKLMVQYYMHEKGKILIGNHPISEICLLELRKQIKYISSEMKLFSGSILYNLTMGNNDISDENFNIVVEGCNLLELIEELPNKFDTKISEGGIELSSGQRQRILIAQALLANPQILIFDEATSHLDEVNEWNIINFILEYCSNKLCIFILHNEKLTALFNNIYILDEGKLVEKNIL